MNHHLERIIHQLKSRPGLSAIQLSDLLDIDPEVVKNILIVAAQAGQVEFVESPGGNGLVVRKYSLPSKTQQAAAQATAQPEIDVEVTRKTPAERAPAAATAAEPQPVDKRSKATIAIEYLVENGPTNREALMQAMGLKQKYAVTSFLKPHLQSGKVVCVDGIYCVPDQPGATAKAAAPAKSVASVADPVKSPAHYTSGGIELVDILRAKLTPEELRGFFKGNVIKYLLRAEHKGGAEDYQKGCVYANWLAAATTTQAA